MFKRLETSQPIQDDSHSDYQLVKQSARHSMKDGVWQERLEERFVDFRDREMRSDLSHESIKAISEGKNYMHYLGVPMAKDPLDKAVYEMLLYELRPKTIIELGAYTGASAKWLADTMALYGVDTRVIAADIDLSLIDDKFRNDPRLEFVQGDCHEIESLFPVETLKQFAHPFVLIDDAHVNLPNVYQYFHDHVFQTGDYLIIEDTNPQIPGTFGMTHELTEDWGDWKFQEIRDFFEVHGEHYAVDCYFTDFFGYNSTWNWNGFIRRQ